MYFMDITPATIAIRVLLSVVVGGLLGLERGMKNRPAGFRTYMLVCLGASMVMMTNQFIHQKYGGTDLTRMGAQVISGIGFLGAGTILITGRHQVTGITTAAGLWTSACLGLAIGIGFYEGALLCGATIFCIMSIFGKLDSAIRNHGKIIDIYLEFNTKKSFSQFLQYTRENNFNVMDIQMNKNKYAKDVDLCVILSIKSLVRRSHSEMLAVISAAEGVSYIEEI